MCLLQGTEHAGDEGMPVFHHDWQDSGHEDHAQDLGSLGGLGLSMELPSWKAYNAASCYSSQLNGLTDVENSFDLVSCSRVVNVDT